MNSTAHLELNSSNAESVKFTSRLERVEAEIIALKDDMATQTQLRKIQHENLITIKNLH